MTRVLALLFVTVALGGCAATYTYNNQRYNSKEEMMAGAEAALARSVNSVVPLPSPPAKRNILFAIPNLPTMVNVSVKTFEQRAGRMIGLGEQIVLTNVTEVNHRSTKALYEVVVRRNLYPATRYIELDTAAPELQASAGEDVLYYYEPTVGSGQWYYVTAKAGKQVFAFDRGGATMEAKTKAFVDAVQAFALRD